MANVRWGVIGIVLVTVAPQADGRADNQAAHGASPRVQSRRQRFETQWWPRVRPLLSACDELANRDGVFGDAIVEFWPSSNLPLRVLPSPGLKGRVSACVTAKLSGLAAQLKGHLDEVEETGGVVSLGTVRPLLPDAQTLVPAWMAAIGSQPGSDRVARVRLARLLPRDVVLSPDGCLETFPTRSFGAAADAWLRREARPVDSFWLNEARLAMFGPDVTEAYVVMTGGSSYLLRRTFFPREWLATQTEARGTPNFKRVVDVKHRICITAIDGATKASLRSEMDDHGKCSGGSVPDTLTAPRSQCSGHPLWNRHSTAGAPGGVH